MMKNFKKEKGITMIALIITIIVILILAGVTLSMIVGDNGIITRSRQAKRETLVAAATEKVQMVTATAQMVIEEENAINGAYDPIEAYSDTSSSIYKAINDELSGSDWEVTASGGKLTINYKNSDYLKASNNENKKYWININSTGAEMVDVKEGMTSKVTAADFGDYVNYDVDIDGNTSDNDWRIFYNDGENIYLIADDYINYGIAPKGRNNTSLIAYTSEGVTSTDTSITTMSMENVINDYTGASDIDSKFTKWLKYLNSYPNCTLNTMKAVAYMLDDSSSVWGKFSNSSAKWSIGGPTLDLFVKSWNEKYPSSSIEIQVSNQQFDMDSGFSKGYKVKRSSDSAWSYGLQRVLTVDTNNLYIIGSIDNAKGMFVASPSANGGGNIFYILYNGNLSYEGYAWMEGQGFRPVVCLKSGIQATESNNVWTLQ